MGMLEKNVTIVWIHLSQETAEVPNAQSMERMKFCTRRPRGGRHDDCSCHRKEHCLQHYREGAKHEVWDLFIFMNLKLN